MADYMVGRKASGNKDKYVVGWNDGKNAPYKVGGGGASVGQSSNDKLGGGDQASPAGAKSAFNHADDNPETYKDIGDRSPNMNGGGTISMGASNDPTSAGGELEISYTEKGSWDDGKNAMARRKAMMDSSKKYYGKNDQFNSPTVDIINVKKD